MVDRNCPKLLRSFSANGGQYICEFTGEPCEVVPDCDERRKSSFLATGKKEPVTDE